MRPSILFISWLACALTASSAPLKLKNANSEDPSGISSSKLEDIAVDNGMTVLSQDIDGNPMWLEVAQDDTEVSDILLEGTHMKSRNHRRQKPGKEAPEDSPKGVEGNPLKDPNTPGSGKHPNSDVPEDSDSPEDPEDLEDPEGPGDPKDPNNPNNPTKPHKPQGPKDFNKPSDPKKPNVDGIKTVVPDGVKATTELLGTIAAPLKNPIIAPIGSTPLVAVGINDSFKNIKADKLNIVPINIGAGGFSEKGGVAPSK
ncbi:hypothetical protein TWF481_009830 [Arthrobotrys musiformis]|uniref:Uncharacterized protein n=1 Tax=Arthrobotrys musiformis TaxID=47236 RepID=A0AAV9W4X4_9PEZI